MAQYQQVHVRFWRDPQVRSWSDKGKLLAQYLLTSAHRATEGLFYLPRAYVAADLNWSTDEVVDTFDEIESFALYDSDVDVVWIVNALKYQPPTGSRQVGGAITRLQQLPNTHLWDRFCAAVSEHAPDLWEKMEEEGMFPDTVYDPENEPSIPYTDTSSDERKGSSDSSSTSNSNSSSNSAPPVDESDPEDRQRRFSVLADVCGLDVSNLTRNERGRLNDAEEQLREVGAQPAEIKAKAAAYRDAWPDATLTPQALANNWAQLEVSKTSQPRGREACPECGAYAGKCVATCPTRTKEAV